MHQQKNIHLSLMIAFGLIMTAPEAKSAIISFTPTGTSTVSQSTDLFRDMLSANTSTSSSFSPYNFYLSNHGDFHFNSSLADMINSGTGTGGVDLAVGTLIGPASNWSNTNGFVGTTDLGGGCSVVNTCIYGLSLDIAGNTHYGWVQFSEDTSTQSLLAWAYEDVAAQPIAAGSTGASVPEPATMSLLTLGVLGAGFFRQIKKRSYKGTTS